MGCSNSNGLRRTYGPVTALDDLTFSVPSGLVVGFLGPNGAGKTTTMRAIFGLTDLESGSVTWNGARSDPRSAAGSATCPRSAGSTRACWWAIRSSTSADCTVSPATTAAAATVTWLERLGIADRARDKVETLSHGNQQRVQLAAALLHDPELLVLDEPLAGLDPTGIDAISAVLVDQARAGCCVLFSSHQLDLVEDLCDVVTIIDHGRLVVSGTVDELVTAGSQRLVVRVEGDRDAAWAQALPGVTVSEVAAGAARLVLDDGVDSDLVLRAAMAAGRVTEFSFGRRRLSEVFRESLQ